MVYYIEHFQWRSSTISNFRKQNILLYIIFQPTSNISNQVAIFDYVGVLI
jgi:hypothetical protein